MVVIPSLRREAKDDKFKANYIDNVIQPETTAANKSVHHSTSLLLYGISQPPDDTVLKQWVDTGL